MDKTTDVKIIIHNINCKPEFTNSRIFLSACISEKLSISQHSSVTVSTGVQITVPDGYAFITQTMDVLKVNGITCQSFMHTNNSIACITLSNGTDKPYHLMPYAFVCKLELIEINKMNITETEV